MARRRLTLKQLRKILRSFGVEEDPSGGKGSHTLFYKRFDEGVFTYPVPNERDVKPCYVRGCRKKFRLLPQHGVTDEDFYSRA